MENQSRVTGLGKGIDQTGNFNTQSLNDSITALGEYSDILKKYKIKTSDTIVTATEASRVAGNAQYFFNRAKDDFGFNIRLLSGEEEAYYSASGVLNFDQCSFDDEAIIFDIGGASTELILTKTKPFKLLHSISIPIGAVRINESSDKNEKIEEILRDIDFTPYCERQLIGTAGSITALASIFFEQREYCDEAIHLKKITNDNFMSLERRLFAMDHNQLLEAYPFLGKRALTIHSGLLIAKAIMIRLKALEFIVSTRGLRFGIIELE